MRRLAACSIAACAAASSAGAAPPTRTHAPCAAPASALAVVIAQLRTESKPSRRPVFSVYAHEGRWMVALSPRTGEAGSNRLFSVTRECAVQANGPDL
jgi:hypothetical protein